MADASPRFEHDLRDIREARGITLQDVHLETRMPVDVLERFERGDLVRDPHYNEIYLKALLRAYASAVGLSPQEVVTAYEATRAGTYHGVLRRHLGEEPPPPPTPPDSAPVQNGLAESSPPPATPEAAPAVAALRQAPLVSSEAAVPRSEPKARVLSRAHAAATTLPLQQSWGLVIGATVLVVVLIGVGLWLLLRDDRPEPIERPRPVAAAPDTVAAPAVDGAPIAPAAGPAPRLERPIRVTVIAQDGPLQNFRVTEEPDVRRPYWLEQGEERTFTSDEAVVIWGSGPVENLRIPPAARLRLQGYTWAPRPEPLRIDPERGQALLDSLHRVQGAPAAAPSPQPDPLP